MYVSYLRCQGLKGLCRENVNIENERKTCLQIRNYSEL